MSKSIKLPASRAKLSFKSDTHSGALPTTPLNEMMGGSRPPQEGERQPRSRDGGTGVPVVLEKLSDLRDKPEAGSGGLPPSVTSGESPEAARESRALPSGLRIHRGVCPITRRGISFRYRLVDMANYVPEHRQARTPNIVIFLPTAPTGPRRRGPGRKYKEAA